MASITTDMSQSFDPQHRSNATDDNRFRIAIAGCGPRGFYCLESLLSRIKLCASSAKIDIHVFEPAAFAGAGFVYDPSQPPYLLMNYAAKHVDASNPTVGAGQNLPSLVDWLSSNYPEQADPEAYVPRAIVGQYLSDCMIESIEGVPENTGVYITREHIQGIKRMADGRWKVAFDSQNDSYPMLFDELVVTCGHGDSKTNSIFPIQSKLNRDLIRPQTNVAIKGFGLTFIDAVLALTEGRGGSFHDDQGEIRYSPCGEEPAMIIPYSRTGRPMLAKPNAHRVKLPSNLLPIWAGAKKELLELPQPETGLVFTKSIWPIVTATAGQVLKLVSNDFSQACWNEKINLWFEQWINQPVDAASVLSMMRKSVHLANGKEALDEGWALGETWRHLYSAIVKRINHAGLDSSSWQTNPIATANHTGSLNFPKIATEMERIAFGPPVENLAKIIGLVESNILSLACLQGNIAITNAGMRITNSRSLPIDHAIDGMSPGIRQCEPAFLAELFRQGLLRHGVGGGCMVDHCGRPIDYKGNSVPGIALLGRYTEGCIVGNDTLSRTLNPHIDNLADDIIERIGSFQSPIH